LGDLKPDLCVIGTNGISIDNGLTDSDWEVVQVIKAMMRAATNVAVVTIAEKFNSVQKIKIADIKEIDYLVTELPPDSPVLAAYRGAEKPALL